jgi:hypothetical protein
VDFLVGWRLDLSLPKTIAAVIAGSFKKFRTFWVANKVFTLDLLGKLVADMFRLSSKDVDPQKPTGKDQEDSGPRGPLPPELLFFLEYVLT